MTNKNNHLIDGVEPKFYARIPNMVVDDLPYAELALYTYYKRVAYDKGSCWQSTATVGKSLKMSPKKVRATRRELEKRGLIVVTSRNEGATKTIRLVNIWQTNIDRYTATPVQNDPPPGTKRPTPESNRTHEEKDISKKIKENKDSSTTKSVVDNAPKMEIGNILDTTPVPITIVVDDIEYQAIRTKHDDIMQLMTICGCDCGLLKEHDIHTLYSIDGTGSGHVDNVMVCISCGHVTYGREHSKHIVSGDGGHEIELGSDGRLTEESWRKIDGGPSYLEHCALLSGRIERHCSIPKHERIGPTCPECHLYNAPGDSGDGSHDDMEQFPDCAEDTIFEGGHDKCRVCQQQLPHTYSLGMFGNTPVCNGCWHWLQTLRHDWTICKCGQWKHGECAFCFDDGTVGAAIDYDSPLTHHEVQRAADLAAELSDNLEQLAPAQCELCKQSIDDDECVCLELTPKHIWALERMVAGLMQTGGFRYYSHKNELYDCRDYGYATEGDSSTLPYDYWNITDAGRAALKACQDSNPATVSDLEAKTMIDISNYTGIDRCYKSKTVLLCVSCGNEIIGEYRYNPAISHSALCSKCFEAQQSESSGPEQSGFNPAVLCEVVEDDDAIEKAFHELAPKPQKPKAKKAKAAKQSPEQKQIEANMFEAVKFTWRIDGNGSYKIIKMKQFFLGTIKKSSKKYGEEFRLNQLDELPATALEVIGFGFWYRTEYDNVPLPENGSKLRSHFETFRGSGKRYGAFIRKAINIAREKALKITDDLIQEVEPVPEGYEDIPHVPMPEDIEERKRIMKEMMDKAGKGGVK